MTQRTNTPRTTRAVLAMVAALSLLLGMPASAEEYLPPEVSPFTDVATTTLFYQEISWMQELGISTGWPDGSYRPVQPVDRDAMAAFIYRLQGSPAWPAPATSPFSDISPGIQFYPEMTWLQNTQITTGWPDGTYRPWDDTDRDAMAAFMYRLAGEPEFEAPAESPFKDVAPDTQFYKEITWMQANGISTGWQDGTYRPWEPVNRDAMAAFMYRLAVNVLGMPPVGVGVVTVRDTPAGAQWGADFDPALAGQQAWLQVQTIATTMTDEASTGRWRTIADGYADAAGDVTFTVGNPLGVSHNYRVVGSTGRNRAISNELTYAAPRADSGTGLATVHIDTNEGAPIDSRENYREGRITMTAGSVGGSTTGNSCSALDNKLLKVRGRGHSTWEEMDKKGYNFSLDKKADLCGMGEAKKWALLANHEDHSLLRNSTAMYIGSLFTNLEYTPESTPVDLYINGEYQGSYTLMERVNVGTGRVEIDELKDNQAGVNDQWPQVSGGYLLEWDFRQDGDHNINVNDSGAWVAINEPEDEDDGSGITQAQISYIDDYLAQADEALFGRNFTDDAEGWQKYIDAASAVDYYIAMELMKPLDGNMHSSVFMYKKRDVTTPGDGKLFFGPLWDFDIAMGDELHEGDQGSPYGWYLRDPNYVEKTQVDVSWFNRLNEDPQFQQMVKDRWNQVSPQLGSVDDFITAQRTLVADSAAKNFTIWDINERLVPEQVIKGSWPAEVDHLQWWLAERIAWMTDQYN